MNTSKDKGIDISSAADKQHSFRDCFGVFLAVAGILIAINTSVTIFKFSPCFKIAAESRALFVAILGEPCGDVESHSVGSTSKHRTAFHR